MIPAPRTHTLLATRASPPLHSHSALHTHNPCSSLASLSSSTMRCLEEPDSGSIATGHGALCTCSDIHHSTLGFLIAQTTWCNDRVVLSLPLPHVADQMCTGMKQDTSFGAVALASPVDIYERAGQQRDTNLLAAFELVTWWTRISELLVVDPKG